MPRTDGPLAGRRVVIIGGGVGGLCMASRLLGTGAEVRVFEAGSRFGGRLAADVVDGFTLSSGALALAFGDELQQSFECAGAPFELTRPDPSVVIRLGRLDLRSGGTVWQHLAEGAAIAIERLTRSLRADEHDRHLSVADWVGRYTDQARVHRLFESMCHTVYTARPDQVPIAELANLLRRTGGFKEFGFAPRGNDELVAGFVSALRARGAELASVSPVEGVTLDAAGAVSGVRVVQGGHAREVPADIVVSNLGPGGTSKLVPEGTMRARFAPRLAKVQPACYLSMYVASTFPLMPHPGLLTLTEFSRASSLGCLTATAPALAPAGWNLYVTGTVPPDRYDLEEETRLMTGDLKRVHSGFLGDDRSRIVRVRTHHMGPDPGHRTLPGCEVPVTTPVSGLYEVGDGSKPSGYTGTSGAAASARVAFGHIVASHAR